MEDPDLVEPTDEDIEHALETYSVQERKQKNWPARTSKVHSKSKMGIRPKAFTRNL